MWSTHVGAFSGVDGRPLEAAGLGSLAFHAQKHSTGPSGGTTTTQWRPAVEPAPEHLQTDRPLPRHLPPEVTPAQCMPSHFSSLDSSRPRDRTAVSYISCTGRRVLYHWCHLRSPGKACQQPVQKGNQTSPLPGFCPHPASVRILVYRRYSVNVTCSTGYL